MTTMVLVALEVTVPLLVTVLEMVYNTSFLSLEQTTWNSLIVFLVILGGMESGCFAWMKLEGFHSQLWYMTRTVRCSGDTPHFNQVQFVIMIICKRDAAYGQCADSHTAEPS